MERPCPAVHPTKAQFPCLQCWNLFRPTASSTSSKRGLTSAPRRFSIPGSRGFHGSGVQDIGERQPADRRKRSAYGTDGSSGGSCDDQPSSAMRQRRRPDRGVHAITETAFLSKNSIRNGTRLIKLEMTKSPPNFLTVAKTRAMIEYRGMRHTYSRCGREDHFGAACKAVRCGQCGAYGHVVANCRPVCKRCGGAHPMPDCVRPCSFASAVALVAARRLAISPAGLAESSRAAGAVSSGTAEVVTSLAEPAVQRDDVVTSPADDQAGKELASSSSSQSATEQTEGT
ncbi:hypothetical protein V5799_029256 [Amblyomma americanum]|uniref:CCHC-type domain-containing protein n=1 Tax=Amblyomma americanum TaxID=6943 RepID=A0AAQ4ERZ0_AMBAM